MQEQKLTLRDFVGREVICCASPLISDLVRLVADASRDTLENIGTDEEELRALCESVDWETAVETYINNMDRDELIAALDEADVEDEEFAEGDPWRNCLDADLRRRLTASIETEACGYEEFGRAHDLDPEYSEVYEHWVVTDWLAARLKDKGEITGEVCSLTIWGRCTSGQMISMDGVIQQIYRDLMGIESKEFIQS